MKEESLLIKAMNPKPKKGVIEKPTKIKTVKAWAVVDINGEWEMVGKPKQTQQEVKCLFVLNVMKDDAPTFNSAIFKWNEYEERGFYRCIPVAITPEGE